MNKAKEEKKNIYSTLRRVKNLKAVKEGSIPFLDFVFVYPP